MIASRLGRAITVDRAVGIAGLAIAVVAPLLFTTYFVSAVLTQALFLGIVAASMIFLSAYGGMVSLAQVAIYGIAGFTLGNAVTTNTKGLNLGWDPWIGVILGIGVATAVALLFGAIASRSAGIYFLMITLTFAVIANYFFGQVTALSGFGGISGIRAPAFVGQPEQHANRLYYVALVVSILVYVLIRYIVRTPAGLSLQGVRDDPIRMSSLGYNVALHRTAAFAFAGFIAALAGVLFVWWNGHIDPASIDLGATLDVLVIAVIGGLYRIEGAWLGAVVFVMIDTYTRSIGFIGDRFHTLIGLIFLVIVLLSPGGLMGIWEAFENVVRHRRLPRGMGIEHAAGTTEPEVGERV
jgi:branched-chain amino acid transport system permease protein